jgi:hypothetical protein
LEAGVELWGVVVVGNDGCCVVDVVVVDVVDVDV